MAVSRRSPITNAGSRASFVLHLDSADFQGQNSVQVKVILHWSPTADGERRDRAQERRRTSAAFSERERAAHEQGLRREPSRSASTIASKIRPRSPEDLREEERIVVYRKLIQEILLNGVAMPDDRTRHVVAELINSIFDVDKMLYFVAPEWWRPRLHREPSAAATRSRPSGRTRGGSPASATQSSTGACCGAPRTPGSRRAHRRPWARAPSAGAASTTRCATTTTSPTTPSRRDSAARSAGCSSSTATTCATRSSTRRGSRPSSRSVRARRRRRSTGSRASKA